MKDNLICFFLSLHVFFKILKYLDQYRINFRGLKDGLHEFVFDVDDLFFKEFELSEVSSGSFTVNVLMDKRPQHITLKFSITGYAGLTCDRCLDLLNLPVTFTGYLYVKFGHETLERVDEVLVLSQSENELDVSQFIYESINLSIPLKRTHPDDENGLSTCNNDMLRIINNMLLHEEHTEDNHIDPRWQELQKLVNNN